MKHLESDLQKNCVRWFRHQYPELSRLLFAVPNGGKRSRIEAAIMYGEGVVSGVADLILLVPRGDYHSLCIEMKYGKNVQSENQKEWGKDVERYGNKYAVCRSIDSFVELVNNYLNYGK